MKPKIDDQIRTQLDAICEKLKAIEEHMAWTIKAEQRFGIGQRVEWSRKAREAGFPTRKKAKRGTVKGVGLFSIVVKLDSLKKPGGYHHAWFNPISGPKLF
jgi:hypothetical protein